MAMAGIDEETIRRIIDFSLKNGDKVLGDKRTKEFVKQVMREEDAFLYFSGLRGLGYKHSKSRNIFFFCLLEGELQTYRVRGGWDWNGSRDWEKRMEKFSCLAQFQRAQGSLWKLQEYFASD